jgi:tetratricopeptide (TPR) repeat protein
MAKRRNRRKSPRQVRRPIPPPPPFWRLRPSSQFGQEILEELQDDPPLAFDLWYAARRVRAWVESAQGAGASTRPTSVRTDRPSPGARADEIDVDDELSFLVKLGSSASAREVGSACAAVCTWAHANDRKETRVHFAELAARADAENPALANAAGRVCREGGLYDRAELWLERGYRLAVTVGARDEAVRALLGNGSLMQERGRLLQARRWFLKGARRAERTGRRRLAAEARHDLLALAAERGNMSEVVEHASAAIELYPLNSPRLPYLAHDFAFVLIRHGLFPAALPLLESFLKVVPPHDLLPGLSTFAWAAAGCGLVHRYEEAERRTLKRLQVDAKHAAPSFIHLAEGARLLGRWPLAETFAMQAVKAAREREQKDAEREAEELLAAVQSRIVAKPGDPGDRPELQPLLRYFALRLRRWKGDPQRRIGDHLAAERGRAAGGEG